MAEKPPTQPPQAPMPMPGAEIPLLPHQWIKRNG